MMENAGVFFGVVLLVFACWYIATEIFNYFDHKKRK